jgi:hypothetical protein
MMRMFDSTIINVVAMINFIQRSIGGMSTALIALFTIFTFNPLPASASGCSISCVNPDDPDNPLNYNCPPPCSVAEPCTITCKVLIYTCVECAS